MEALKASKRKRFLKAQVKIIPESQLDPAIIKTYVTSLKVNLEILKLQKKLLLKFSQASMHSMM